MPLEQNPEMANQPGETVVRLAQPTDAEIVARILRCAFEPLRDLYTAEAIAYTMGNADTARKRMGEGPVWLAELRAPDEDDSPGDCGTASAVLHGRRAYLRGMAVLEEARGRGVGPSLLAEVRRFAEESGAEAIYLHTTPFLKRAISLYEQFGFQRTSEGPHDLHGTPLVAMEMRLQP